MSFTVDAVIDDLGYRLAGDLLDARTPSDDVALPRRQAWQEASERLGIEAAYFHGSVPLVYFHGLRLRDEQEIDLEVERLHRQAWNHGRAPFVVVVLPDEVRVLDSLSAPFQDYTLLTASKHVPLEEALSEFTCTSLISGGLVDRLRKRPRRQPVVDRLRHDLRVARRSLVGRGMPTSSANDLLGRSMFLRYLHDRGVLADVVPQMAAMSLDNAFHGPIARLYELFSAVHARFNGDVFPVTEIERDTVERAHLDIVWDFLRGHRDGQLQLVSYYDFSVIPAELLSAVYEEFLTDVRKEEAAYYTPQHLVDLALDEILPHAPVEGRRTVLDPACGSGLFLARAYRRLIGVREAHRKRRLTPAELSELLASCIFGCDSVGSAVRVAAFSCYLVLLDHCTRHELRNEVRFPAMLERNLLVGDFFDRLEQLRGPFDFVASNPPWKTWTLAASSYVSSRAVPVADKQIAHAFFWACQERLTDSGQMSLVMPAKALYNRSSTGVAFRRAMVEQTGIELVLDLSAFRHDLFANATAPTAILIGGGPDSPRSADLTFCTPHPTPLSESSGRLVVTGDTIKRMPRAEAARRPGLFKAMLAGTLRDANLLQLLAHRFPSLGELESDGLLLGAGYQVQGGGRLRSELLNSIPRVASSRLKPFVVEELAEPANAEFFHRTRNPLIFHGPHVLVARSIDASGHVQAAFLAEDASFTDSVLGIADEQGSASRLLALTALLNSSLIRYMLFLSATSWGTERPRLEPQDLRGLPIALPPAGSAEERSLGLIAEEARHGGPTPSLMNSLDRHVFGLYGLGATQRSQVTDLLSYGLDLHYRRARSSAFQRPDAREYDRYRQDLEQRLSSALDVEVSSRVLDDGTPYTGISFGLGEPPIDSFPWDWGATPDLAERFDSDAIMVRRIVRRYRHRGIDVAKPAEIRYWTASAAAQDADDIIAECLRATLRDNESVTA